MSIVPVRVRVGGGRAVSTYAFLDNGSSTTFCTESLLQELGIEDAEPAQLSLCTVDPEVTKVESQIVTDLHVSDMSETQFIDLPPVYTLPKIPVTHDDIPKQHDLLAWPHLHSIHLQDIDADIGLMIGNNVPEATEPWEIRHGQPGEPFAAETKLGWVVNGPVKPTKDMLVSKVNHRAQERNRISQQMEAKVQEAKSLTKGSEKLKQDSTHKEQALAAQLQELRERCSRLAQESAANVERALAAEAALEPAEAVRIRLQEETSTLRHHVEELTRRAEDAENETAIVRKKHHNSVRELQRELAQARRRQESRDPSPAPTPSDGLSQASRASSSVSLHEPTPVEPTPVVQVTGPLEPERQVLIERIVELQRQVARRSEKIDFLEDHINTVVERPVTKLVLMSKEHSEEV